MRFHWKMVSGLGLAALLAMGGVSMPAYADSHETPGTEEPPPPGTVAAHPSDRTNLTIDDRTYTNIALGRAVAELQKACGTKPKDIRNPRVKVVMQDISCRTHDVFLEIID